MASYSKAAVEAFKRGIVFTLTAEQFAAARDGDCAYCGAAIPERITGLDRVNGARGYEPGNVVPCCEWCNKAKNTLTGDEWIRVIGPAVELHGKGNVWPAAGPRLSDEERASREAVAGAWAACCMVSMLWKWARRVASAERARRAEALRVELGLDRMGRTPGQVAADRKARDEAARATRKRYVAEHVAAGLCAACPLPAIEGRRHCATHDKYARDYHEANYWAGREGKKRCGVCGAKGHTAPRCPEKDLLDPSDAVRWASTTKAARERAWWQARAEDRKANGLCIRCGAEPHIDGLSECVGCKKELAPTEQRQCWVCAALFTTTTNALKKTCGARCERAVVNWRRDRKSSKLMKESWPTWKKEMWLRLHPEHPDHATYCIQVADASAA